MHVCIPFFSFFFLTKLAYAPLQQQLAPSTSAHLHQHKVPLRYKRTAGVYSLSWRIYFHINGFKLRRCPALKEQITLWVSQHQRRERTLQTVLSGVGAGSPRAATGVGLYLPKAQGTRAPWEPSRAINRPQTLNLNPKGEQLRTYSATTASRMCTKGSNDPTTLYPTALCSKARPTVRTGSRPPSPGDAPTVGPECRSYTVLTKLIMSMSTLSDDFWSFFPKSVEHGLPGGCRCPVNSRPLHQPNAEAKVSCLRGQKAPHSPWKSECR